MAISKERRNEIAWLVILDKMKEKGLPNLKSNEFQREVKNAASRMEVSVEEAMAFAEELIIPLVNELFAEKKKFQIKP